jgi:hypothetical protein
MSAAVPAANMAISSRCPPARPPGRGGVHCTLYVWDRPLSAQSALRLRSESCEAPGHPGLFIAHELDRTVIPLSSSTLAQGEN